MAFPKVSMLEPCSGAHGALSPSLVLVMPGGNLHPFSVMAGLKCFAKLGLCGIRVLFTSKKMDLRGQR